MVPRLNLQPFDEDVSHREILPYREVYPAIFESAKQLIESKISDVFVMHIGSTAVKDLRGKPMIDIIATTNSSHLRSVQADFETLGFHRRDVWTDRDDKPYVCASISWHGERFNINVHICHKSDPLLDEYRRFLEVLRSSESARREYEFAKDRAHSIDPQNPEIYNSEKAGAISKIMNDDRNDA